MRLRAVPIVLCAGFAVEIIELAVRLDLGTIWDLLFPKPTHPSFSWSKHLISHLEHFSSFPFTFWR